MKKNVLQLVGSFHQGGSERQAVQLTRLLREDGRFNVFITTLNAEGILRREVEKLGFAEIPEFKLNSFFDANFLRQIRKCAEFIRKNNIGIIHTHDFYTNIFGMAATSLNRGVYRIASKRETGGMRTGAQKFVEKQAFRRANKIVVNSLAVKNYLIEESIPDEKIKVIYNGLDLKRLTPQLTNRQKICEMFNLPSEKNVKFITSVANLRHEVKNQPMFLRAAQRILPKFPNTHFIIAGEGELKKNLEDSAEKMKISQNIHFVGRCDHVPELLFVSEICALTSFAEGFSNSILEYMAAAKPVVATDVGGAREAVSDGETGFLVASNDDELLANRLIELLRDESKAARFGRKGREIVEEKFSERAQLENTVNLYQNEDEKNA